MKELLNLYAEHYRHPPQRLEEIPRSVSARRYYRMFGEGGTVIGTWSPDINETEAFVHFTEHFRSAGVQVPEVFVVSNDRKFYLQEDLGDQRLHELVVARNEDELGPDLVERYRQSLEELLKLQLKGGQDVDYSLCVPRPAFDAQSVLWDLNHFKYYFLKLSGVPFDEQKLESEFQAFATHIESLPLQGFMFRDFQTRNIMIRDGKPWLIDYQGGRRGPLQYDLASLVYESKAGLTSADREKLVGYYIENLAGYLDVNREEFMADFYTVALVRSLQVLGAYGLRGIVEKKAVFLQSIPAGLGNMGEILGKVDKKIVGEYLHGLLNELVGTRDRYREMPPVADMLTLTIFSFSYRKPLPDDLSGNGGGYVYDCRWIKNPGLLDEYRLQTGLDEGVVEYLEADPGVKKFSDSIRKQLLEAITVYKERAYRHLMVSFGCTGGRHRSVYLAHEIAAWARNQEGVRVLEIHRELGKEY